VNNTADAAAKRLGIALPSSSSSSSSSKNASKTTTTASSGGQNPASKNIDQLLASLDGHPPAPAASTSTGTPFNLNSYLGSLDRITAGSAVGKSNTPTGKNFSIDSYLQTLDAITPHSPSLVNLTT